MLRITAFAENLIATEWIWTKALYLIISGIGCFKDVEPLLYVLFVTHKNTGLTI